MATERVLLGHGGGGRLTRDLIETEIVPRFGDGPLGTLPDAASLMLAGARLVFTTDSFVVTPWRFPGGDIGSLAVHGTVNDLAVAGGRPAALSLALILEEGFALDDLRHLLDSVRKAADACGVAIVTGDTKVVGRGQADGVYVNTSGIGLAIPGFALDSRAVAPGDAVLTSGPLGDHGIAVMAAREGIAISGAPPSDSAPVHRLVEAAAAWAPRVRFMRDPTRGGVASVLHEIVDQTPCGIELDEALVPFSRGARAVAEMLGLDLLHVASEGRMLLVCEADVADAILWAWRALPEGKGAARIGTVTREAGRVAIKTSVGGRRLIDVPLGELLPRIC